MSPEDKARIKYAIKKAKVMTGKDGSVESFYFHLFHEANMDGDITPRYFASLSEYARKKGFFMCLRIDKPHMNNEELKSFMEKNTLYRDLSYKKILEMTALNPVVGFDNLQTIVQHGNNDYDDLRCYVERLKKEQLQRHEFIEKEAKFHLRQKWYDFHYWTLYNKKARQDALQSLENSERVMMIYDAIAIKCKEYSEVVNMQSSYVHKANREITNLLSNFGDVDVEKVTFSPLLQKMIGDLHATS
jgi:hypothetical protein